LLRIWFSFQRACGLFSSMASRRKACRTLLRLVVKLCNCYAGKRGRVLQHAAVFLAMHQQFFDRRPHTGLRTTAKRQLFRRALAEGCRGLILGQG
jgi:hypothetical protein